MLRAIGRRLTAAAASSARKLDDGTVLTGTFDGDRLVKGVVVLPDGRRFEGRFAADTGAPAAGAQLVEDGDVYVGDFNARWQRHGAGRAWLVDGTSYEGTFEGDELREGTVVVPPAPGSVGGGDSVFTGTLVDEQFVEGTLRQGNFVYTGAFKDNQPHGKGRLEFDSGALHEGTFLHGKLHGTDCKLRLENGSVYLGSFIDGQIVSGELRTPTFSYDGEFNDQGQAHGVGRSEYLTCSPRLIFTGRWHCGNFYEGNVVDEFDCPVDSRSAVEQVAGKDAAMSASMNQSTLQSARLRKREMDAAFAADHSEAVAAGARVRPVDLGYELGPNAEVQALERKAEATERRLGPDAERATAAAAEVDRDAGAALKAALGETSGSLDRKVKDAMRRTHGDNHAAGRHMDEQFARFEEKLEKGRVTTGEAGRRVDSNEAWTGFTR